jgi:hypothetical protein
MAGVIWFSGPYEWYRRAQEVELYWYIDYLAGAGSV